MPPEIAPNRWLTCGCIVSATRKITDRCRWRCPCCRSLLMPGFPVILTLPFVWSSRVTPCALVLSIPASRDWGPCCALWRWWCPPPPPPPSVRPSAQLSSSPVLNPETPAEPLHRVQVRENITISISAATPTRTWSPSCCGVQGGFPLGMTHAHTQTHARTAHKHTPLALYSSHHRR